MRCNDRGLPHLCDRCNGQKTPKDKVPGTSGSCTFYGVNVSTRYRYKVLVDNRRFAVYLVLWRAVRAMGEPDRPSAFVFCQL